MAEPGMRKNELVSDIVQSAFHGTQDALGDYPAIVTLTRSSEDATAPHLTCNEDVLKRVKVHFLNYLDATTDTMHYFAIPYFYTNQTKKWSRGSTLDLTPLAPVIPLAMWLWH